MNSRIIIVGLVLIGASFALDAADLFPKTVNFVILLGILLFFGKDPILGMLSASAKERAKDYIDARDKESAAQRNLNEALKDIGNMESDLSEYKESVMRRAEEEGEKIIADAEQLAKDIVTQAESRIKYMTEQAKQEIKSHLISEAINEAKADIKTGKAKVPKVEDAVQQALSKA